MCGLRIFLTLTLLLGCAVPSRAANLLLVIQGSSPNSEESARQSQLQAWGHTVTTIQDSSSQAAFDTAVASADVVYVCHTIQQWELSYKLRTAACGVINESAFMEVEFGFFNGGGYT